VQHVDHGADLGQPVLDLIAVPFQPLGPADIAYLIRIRQLGGPKRAKPLESGPRCFMD